MSLNPLRLLKDAISAMRDMAAANAALAASNSAMARQAAWAQYLANRSPLPPLCHPGGHAGGNASIPGACRD